MIKIAVAESATPEMLVSLNVLVRELPQTAPLSDLRQLAQIVASPSAKLLTASADGAVVGMLALVVFRIPTGLRARIEDVAVLASHRRMGIADMLTREAIRVARELGVRSVDLTASHTKVAAHELYAKAGFRRRDTHVYRYEL